MAEFTINSISICSNFEMGGEKTLNDYINAISMLDTPSSIRNRIAEINTEEEEESQLLVGLTSEGNPIESDNNYLILNSYQGNRCHVHIFSDYEYIGEFSSFLSDISNIVGELELDPITYRIEIGKEFKSLDLQVNVQLPEEFEKNIWQVSGVRFDIGDADSDYLFQKNPDKDTTQLRHGRGPIQVDSESVENIIQSELEEASSLIGGL